MGNGVALESCGTSGFPDHDWMEPKRRTLVLTSNVPDGLVQCTTQYSNQVEVEIRPRRLVEFV